MSELAPRILRVIEKAQAVEQVTEYFSESQPTFSGRHFETVGGSGAELSGDTFTAADLVAVQMLSVTVPAEVSFAILESSFGRELILLLQKVPANVELGSDDAEQHLRDGSPAERAWSALKNREGIGYVTAGKLLARKRPQLIPVYDSVVRCVFRRPHSVWLKLDEAMRHERLRQRLHELRAASGAQHVSLLRTLDVALWMSHHAAHGQGNHLCEANSEGYVA